MRHSLLLRCGLVLSFLATVALSGAADGDGAPGPMLYFKPSDVAALRQRIATPEYADLWKTALDAAKSECDPQSPDYADPAIYAKPLDTAAFAGASYARKLSLWMETLGFAYQMTGDEEFGKHGAALLAGAAQCLTVDSKPIAGQFVGFRGDMMRGLASGLDFFSDALTPEQRAVVAATGRGYILSIANEYAQPTSQWHHDLLPHNFDGVCGGALGMLAIALRNDFADEAPDWIKLGETLCNNWLGAGFDKQGAYFEGVLYMDYGVGNIAIFSDALHRYLGRTTFIDHPILKQVPYFLAMERLPGDAAFDARNDSLYSIDLAGTGGIASPYLLLMASGYNGAIAGDPMASWLWRNAAPKKGNQFLQIVWGNKAPAKDPSQLLPPPFGAYFADRGLCIWRTGWNKDDTMFSIEAGPYHPVTHNQADKGHFNLYGLGYRWAADTGYGNNHEVGGRCQTTAHSCVLVDGKGQALSGAALGTDGKVLKEENNARYGYALIDAQSAYNHNNKNMIGLPLTKALRHAFFLRPSGGIPAYAVVLDDIEWGGQPHKFSWQMITWADMAVQAVGNDTFWLRPGGVSATTGPKMKVILHASAPMTLGDEPFTPDKYGGRLPNDYHRIHAAATTGNPHFVAVLAPLPPGAPEPALTVEENGDGRLIHVAWGSRTDTISWNGDEAKLLDAAP